MNEFVIFLLGGLSYALYDKLVYFIIKKIKSIRGKKSDKGLNIKKDKE